jgi:putative phage-type endonuclease
MDIILKKRVERLVLFNNEQQKSEEWFQKRHEMVTASDIAAIFDTHPYLTKKQLLIQKCSPVQNNSNEFTDWGELFEPVALRVYKRMFLVDHIHESGCIQHPKYDFVGASPDGILSNGTLIEIKCPKNRTISKKIPHMYWIQMQIQMEVCNLNECDFFQCKFYKYDSKADYVADVTSNMKGHIQEHDVYWKLEKSTIVTVKRDVRWFINHIGLIARFWKSVLYYRQVGIEHISDQKNELYKIMDWTQWIAATSVKNYLLNDTCLDYIQLLKRGISSVTDAPESDKNTTKTVHELLNEKINYGSTFIEMICNQGVAFEHNVMKLILNQFRVKTVCTDISQARSSTKFKETLKYMRSGAPMIYQGVLHGHHSKTYGIPDLIVRSDIVNRLVHTPVYTADEETIGCRFSDSYHYVIVDIKYSTLKLCSDGVHLLNSGMTKATKGQIYIYNLILGELQGYQPNRGYVLGKKWKYRKNNETFVGNSCFDRLGVIDYTDHDVEYVERVHDALDWCREIRVDFDKFTLFPPNDQRLYPNMCNAYDHPYHPVKMKLASDINEITSIWYCNTTNRQTAFNNGVYNWKTPDCNVTTLNVTGEWKRPRIQAILEVNQQSKEKVRCVDFKNSHDWVNEHQTDLYVDYETVNKNDFVSCTQNNAIYSDDESIIVMIGCGWCVDGEWRFQKFTVDSISRDEERIIMNAFYEFVQSFGKNSVRSPRLYHWGHIERSMYESLRRRNPMFGWGALNWVDLCKIVQDEIIVFHGALTYNIKNVCNALYANKLVKTNWTSVSKCVNGLDAMVNIMKCDDIARESNISLRTMDVIKDIEKYNEIDCKAMWEILNVIRNYAPTSLQVLASVSESHVRMTTRSMSSV